MIVLRFYQFLAAIFLAIIGAESQFGPDGPFVPCIYAPSQQDHAEVVVYINGGTAHTTDTLALICSLLGNDKLPITAVPLTIKVGANVRKNGNDYICVDSDLSISPSCNGVFRYACMNALLPQDQFRDFLCCSVSKDNGFELCLDDIHYRKPLDDCMAGSLKPTADPQGLAVANSDEVAGKGASRDQDYSPYFLFNGLYDKCTSEQAAFYYAETICVMLSDAAKLKVPACN